MFPIYLLLLSMHFSFIHSRFVQHFNQPIFSHIFAITSFAPLSFIHSKIYSTKIRVLSLSLSLWFSSSSWWFFMLFLKTLRDIINYSIWQLFSIVEMIGFIQCSLVAECYLVSVDLVALLTTTHGFMYHSKHLWCP